MLVSTRGRYALRVMVDLAEHYSDKYIPMKDVAKRQGLSLKYIEKIMPLLTKGKLVYGIHGKGGGYRLSKSPADYNVCEILELTEGSLAPVACIGNGAEPCGYASQCKTLPMWNEFHKMAKDYFSSISLTDLMKNETQNDYSI
ncbi:MAG: RrF2 family transcriptional regulator [Clostridia bacterium]|nr:RrF2 family transcriptional regulator [Clostridia bacterium]